MASERTIVEGMKLKKEGYHDFDFESLRVNLSNLYAGQGWDLYFRTDHESTVAQKEHVQILANAISGKNADVKMGEKLEQLGFADHDAIRIAVKINATPELEKSLWGFTDAQLTTLAQDILEGNLNY